MLILLVYPDSWESKHAADLHPSGSPPPSLTSTLGFKQPFLPTPTVLGIVIMQAFHHVTGRVDCRACGRAPKSDAEPGLFSY